MTMTQQWWMQETYRLSMLRKRRIALSRQSYASYIVNVVAGQTHTIQLLRVSAATVVDWGDGLSDEYTSSATRTHVYASAGTYAVKIYTPENVTYFDLRDGAAVSVLNSADLKGMVNVSTFRLDNLRNANITLNSSDMVDWRPSNFQLISLPSASITLNSADWVDWRPGYFYLLNLPNASITIAPSTIKNWVSARVVDLRTGNLTQSQCDLVLWECYQIARTRTGGTIDLTSAGNAAPSGTFQACQSPPVSSSTPGKEIAYELKDDSLSVGFNKWATVTTN